MNRIVFLVFISLIIISSCTSKKEISDWRGHNRDGIYNETGLLKQWPEKGSKLLWSFEGIGFGHSAVAVANDRVFVAGIKDTIDSQGTLFIFDMQGKLMWEKNYGKDFSLNFHGTRSTPVIIDDLIYIESGMGALYCLNAETGDEVWSKDFIADFGVDSVLMFGYSESVLIDGDNLICVPGAKENNVLALNRFTGEKVWSCAGEGEIATYNSPILVHHNGLKLVIAMTAGSVMGIDATNGEKYWSIEQTQQNKIHANTPIYADGKIVVASAGRTTTSGMVQLELLEDGKSVSEVWRNKKFVNLMGGLVKLDSCLYGSAYMKKDWQVIDWDTGETLVQNKEIGGGAIIYADGLFYCYAERDGEVALAEASPEKFEIISKFKVPLGTKEHWARPVINKGVLYIRHGDALMAYDVKAKS